MINNIEDWLNQAIQQAFSKYGLVIACLVIGFFLGWQIKYWASDRKYIKQLKISLSEKDNQIIEFKFIIHERLNKIIVNDKNKTYFKRLKKFFRNTILNK